MKQFKKCNGNRKKQLDIPVIILIASNLKRFKKCNGNRKKQLDILVITVSIQRNNAMVTERSNLTF